MSLKINDLSKSFKSEMVLDGVSLEVPTGQTLVLFGPSGAGKTVLLRCIAGAEDPEAGQIIINGEDVTEYPPERRGVGMAFQNFALFPHMSAFDNIASPLTAQRSTRNRIREGVEAVSRLLKIDHVLGHPPRALSNGQKQRTALARALVAEPDILLLDDPLRNVDAKLRFEMRLELPRLLADRGATVVYVTQDYKEAMALGDQIAVLQGCQVAQAGTPDQIYLRPATVDIANHFGDPSINLLDVVPSRGGSGTYVEISGHRVSLPSGYDAAHGQDCIFGIRPEALRFTSGPGIPVTVEAETPLNEKTVTLSVTKGGREILISRPAGTIAPASGAAMIEMNAADAILFDRATGERIPRATGETAGEAAA